MGQAEQQSRVELELSLVASWRAGSNQQSTQVHPACMVSSRLATMRWILGRGMV
jgi:hypothetical protein